MWVGGGVGDWDELLGGEPFEKGFYEISKTMSTGEYISCSIEYISCSIRSLFHYNAAT